MIASATILVAVAAAGVVELHGGLSVDTPVVSVTKQGIAVGDVGSPSWISWDRIVSVTGEAQEAAQEYLPLGDELWRARTRLARGDVSLAEPIFEDLFDMYVHTDGATALVVAEGRLRCALHRGEQARAVIPWLEVVRLRGLGERMAGEPPLPVIVDSETSLLPALPPFFLGEEEALRESLQEWARAEAGEESLAGVLAGLFGSLIGGETVEVEGAWQEHGGVAILATMHEAQSDDAAVRARGQRGLEELIGEHGDTWIEAWCRVGLGESMIAEGKEDSVRSGVLELLHLPARFSGTQVYLSGYALDRASVALRALGDDQPAERLIRSLLETQPLHPAAARHREHTVTGTSSGQKGTQ